MSEPGDEKPKGPFTEIEAAIEDAKRPRPIRKAVVVFGLFAIGIFLKYGLPLFKSGGKGSSSEVTQFTAVSNSPAISQTTTGNNSPAAVSTGGSSPIVQQNASVSTGNVTQIGNQTINNYYVTVMTGVEQSRKAEFGERFPLGYTLFTLTESTNVVPFVPSRFGRVFVDWSKPVKYTMSVDRIFLSPPPILIASRGFSENYGNMYALSRKVGSNIKFGMGEIMVEIELVRSVTQGEVLLLGARPKTQAEIDSLRKAFEQRPPQ